MKNWRTLEPDKVQLTPVHFTAGRGGRKIRFVTRHHMMGRLTTADCVRIWRDRPASAHYCVEPDGQIGQAVWDRDTAWANADAVANAETIAIEHANDGGPDWSISDTVIINGARLAAAVCFVYKLGRPVFGVNIRDHREFTATQCPYHLANGNRYHARWMAEAQRFYDELSAPPKPTAPKEPAMPTSADLALDQLAGPDRTEQGAPTFSGWPQLGNRTLVDAVAAIGAALKVPGMQEPK